MSPRASDLYACCRALIAALVLAGQLFATAMPAASSADAGLSSAIAATICHVADGHPAGEPGQGAPGDHRADCPLCPSCAAVPMAALLPHAAARPFPPVWFVTEPRWGSPVTTGPPTKVFDRPQPTGPPVLRA